MTIETKISHTNQNIQNMQETRRLNNASAPSQDDTTSAPSTTTVNNDRSNATSVSLAGASLERSFGNLSSQDEVDLDRVNAIRQAIADGSLDIDNAELAQDIIQANS